MSFIADVQSHLELRKSIGTVLDVLQTFIPINTWFVAVNDGESNCILKVLNRREAIIFDGEILPYLETYCSLVATESYDGVLWIEDTSKDERTKRMSVTRTIGRNAFIGAPIQLRNGMLGGTICGLDGNSFEISATQIQLLTAMADYLSYVIRCSLAGTRASALV